MSYKTILVHVDESKHLDSRIEIAATIAAVENAHLIGLAITGLSEYLLYEPLALNPADPALIPFLETLRQRAATALKNFEDAARRAGVASYERRLVENETARGISLQARHCDLVVLGQPDPDEPAFSINSDLPEYVVMNCGGPGLVVPYVHTYTTIVQRVLIAWNASIEAARAVHYAIPLLQRAKTVDLVIFNADDQPEDVYGVPPGADIKLYLARHNIDVNVIQRKTEIDIGDALLQLAANLTSDLMVMGCYGRSRFREILLGGATRTVLTSMTIPVLMSH